MSLAGRPGDTYHHLVNLSRPRLRPLAALTLLAGCAPSGVLAPAGPVGVGERLIMLNSLAIMLGIVVPTILATLAFAWWFRAGNTRARYRPDWSYSGRVELLVWSVPALVVIFLAGITWIGSHNLDPSKPLVSKSQPIRVQVVALDWKWLFIYPGQEVASVNRLVVPAGTPIEFRITSATVMNSFFVPQLGGQIYAMSGMETTLHLQADKPGQYRGLSAHYSGKGFPSMTFMVDAVPPAQFAAWVAQTRTQGLALDRSQYLNLTHDSVNVKPYTYRAVAPRLFDAVVADRGTTTAKTAKDGREQ